MPALGKLHWGIQKASQCPVWDAIEGQKRGRLGPFLYIEAAPIHSDRPPSN